MKKIALLLFSILCSHLNAAKFQIEFVDNFNINVITENPLFPGVGTQTSDATVNSIFTTYGVINCLNWYESTSVYIFAEYNGSNSAGFMSDLLAYSNVQRVRVCYNTTDQFHTFADRLYIKLFTATDGNPTGTNSNQNIVTTNAELNTVFDTYDVTIMLNLVTTFYEIRFEGDITQLHNELNSLTGVIENIDLQPVVMLNNSDFEQSNASIAPNPFSTSFEIQTNETILLYKLVDFSGKELLSTQSKIELDAVSSSLSVGMYSVNLQFANGLTTTLKIIKQ